MITSFIPLRRWSGSVFMSSFVRNRIARLLPVRRKCSSRTAKEATACQAFVPAPFVPGKTQHQVAGFLSRLLDRIDIDSAAPGHRRGVQLAFAHVICADG